MTMNIHIRGISTHDHIHHQSPERGDRGGLVRPELSAKDLLHLVVSCQHHIHPGHFHYDGRHRLHVRSMPSPFSTPSIPPPLDLSPALFIFTISQHSFSLLNDKEGRVKKCSFLI